MTHEVLPSENRKFRVRFISNSGQSVIEQYDVHLTETEIKKEYPFIQFPEKPTISEKSFPRPYPTIEDKVDNLLQKVDLLLSKINQVILETKKPLLMIIALFLMYGSDAKPKKGFKIIKRSCIGAVIGGIIGNQIAKPADNAWLWPNYTKIDPNRPLNKTKVIGTCVGIVVGAILIHYPYMYKKEIKNKKP